MTTLADIARFEAMAGPEYLWDGVRGGSRPASDVRIPLRLDLAARQGFICFDCGLPLDETAEFCHVVSRGPNVKGWHPGNIGVGHSTCNTRQKHAGDVVRDAKRLDLVPVEWTPFPVLRASK